MSNAVGGHLIQEEGEEWRAEETEGGVGQLTPKVEHSQLKFLVAPLLIMGIGPTKRAKISVG